MNRDDIIRMARDAGFIDADQDSVWITDGFWTRELERFAHLVAEQERQACARVVMSFKNWSRVELLPISEAIKSRHIDINRSNP